MLIRSRRDFLKSSIKSVTTLGAMGALAKFGEISAFASTTPSRYQALVCIFLTGGNDGHNIVIPISTAQQKYSIYQKTRQGLALSERSLLPIANGNDAYGLHPSLTEIQQLYNQGKAAVVANVGMLVQPLSRGAYQSGNSALTPNALFSHSDQASQWQSAVPSGQSATGWGGRLTDLMQSQNSEAIFPALSTISSCGLFCTGKHTFPATVTGGGMPGIKELNTPSIGDGVRHLLTFDDGLQLVQAGNSILERGQTYADTLTGLLSKVKLKTQFPANNELGTQLQTVARVMSVRNQLKLTKQIFFCQISGFDTHQGQLEQQSNLMKEVSQAVAAFYQATQELAIENDVTTFTASEFGRTLTPSGTNGSDHAWGSHHFIIGGGVQGGKIYGEFPPLVVGAERDATTRGILIPTTAVAQYGATLSKWFGVGSDDLSKVFPNIGNFPSPTLSFLG